MENKTQFKIVLHAPEIPGNTGSIGRTCVALNLELILIKPYGFDIDEKAVRRAGLDYWKHVKIKEYDSFDHFLEGEKPALNKLFFFENATGTPHYDGSYTEDCYLIFGSETKGLPKSFYETYKDQMFELPMYSEHIRSLNLSNVATTVAYECIRHINYKN
ncbi:MAG: tRNA (cytidine(34)-2'-O)-methyltransferase [Bacteriovoracaceae bacterium]|jgi:tRNA (cytidine/uridine-2'-O-)-methyltransferase|nr:tRNA (cytidine(34)-2'-O)-methyltransferase [Bacteriovoracaceae bacterium]